MKLILASASPRRRELMAQMGLDFEVRVADCDENADISDPRSLVHELALRKAHAVSEIVRDDGEADGLTVRDGFAVIGSDTVVALDNIILGKPRDREDAIATLLSLSGKTHSVFTGLAVVYSKGGEFRELAEVCETRVTFTELTRREAQSYVDTGEPLDKAGSYGIQGRGGVFVSAIEGDYYSVVGLPICKLSSMLKSIGFER